MEAGFELFLEAFLFLNRCISVFVSIAEYNTMIAFHKRLIMFAPLYDGRCSCDWSNLEQLQALRHGGLVVTTVAS